jgi:ribosomal protein L22
MSTETIVTTDSRTDTVDAPPQPLARVAEEIRRDSQRDAAQYLEETKVPHGGE